MKNVTAVIVTYNPDIPSLEKMIEVLSSQVKNVILIDNFSNNQKDLIQLEKYCQTYFLSTNTGIAFAQNEGVKAALENGSDGIIFFDQDSLIGKTMVLKLISSFDKLSKLHRLAGIGPIHKDRRNKFFYPLIKINRFGGIKKLYPESLESPTRVDLIISSGSLISAQALQKVGLMNEVLFIDYVDTEWCLRAKILDYEFYVDPDVVLEHEIGESILKIGGWHIPVHSPSRRYYRLRNGFYLFRLPHFPILLCLKEISQNIAHQILLIFTTDRKIGYLKEGWRGIRDGVYLCFDRYKN